MRQECSAVLLSAIKLLTCALLWQASAGVGLAADQAVVPAGFQTKQPERASLAPARSAPESLPAPQGVAKSRPAPSGAAGIISLDKDGLLESPSAAGNASEARAETTAPGTSYSVRRDTKLALSSFASGDQGSAPRETGPASGKVLNWETGAATSYLIPTLEEVGFLILLNAYDRTVLENKREDNGKRTYDTNFSTVWDHLRKEDWAYDTDPFNVNQIGHPYQGATMYGIARSTGLGFWKSLAYSNAGSFMWEMAGENSRPSVNDIITTGNAGSLLGEALFRMSELVLKEDGPKPDAWHEIGAAVLSPPTAFNRWAYGERFKTKFPSYDPATFWRVRLGASLSGNSDETATLDFQMSYGLPGKTGYSYQRPFDYFDFQMGGLSRASNPVSYVLLRGLLYGRDYQAGENYRGIWGLYGGYDYLSPTVFRVSTTALSLGTTGQYWMAHGVALQGTLLGGVGFGAAGKTPADINRRDYHYGVTPQMLLALRLVLGNQAALEWVTRGYYVSGTGSDNAEGSEQIIRMTAGFTVRVYRRHGVGLQFVESIRNAQYGNHPGIHQSDGTVSLVYTFLGDSHFGAVEWRDLGSR